MALMRPHGEHLYPRTSPPPVRVMRIYVDGSFGVGKTTTIIKTQQEAAGMHVLCVCEPMKYWRSFFVDVVEEVYTTAEKKRSWEIEARHAAAILGTAQLQFANPFVVLHNRCAEHFGPLSEIRGKPDLLLLYDRHSSAACLCFPAARYLLQDISIEVLITLSACLPREPPGGNILVACLDDEEEHLQRLASRARPGEVFDLKLLRALNVIYCMFINTIDLANAHCKHPSCEYDWERGWEKIPWFDDKRRTELLDLGARMTRPSSPRLELTLLSLFKVPQLCDGQGRLLRVYAWGLGSLLSKLRGICIDKLHMDKNPSECAASVMSATANMLVTHTSFTSQCELENAITTFNEECG